MSADNDIGLDEKRVYEGDERETTVYVASETGVVAVSVVGERVGEFELVERCVARDVDAGPAGVAVATETDVLLDAGGGFAETGFGAASAVAVDAESVLAAAPDGTVERYVRGAWRDVGETAGVEGMDGDMLATVDGVYRALDGGLRHAGLASAVDVAAAGVPLAATEDALYRLGNGWLEVVDGAFTFVASDPGAEPGALGRAHAGTAEALFAHHDGAWEVETALERPVVDVAYGDTVYAVSADGRFAAETPDDWRHQELGVRGVAGAVAHVEDA